MSITQGVLAQSPEPEAHDKVLDNNPDRIGIWKCWFLRRGENRSIRRKPLGPRTRTNNKLNPHMTPSPGIEPGPHWWEACVGGKCSTTAPSLLPAQTPVSQIKTCFGTLEVFFKFIFCRLQVVAFDPANW